ncbi:hypothetical protein ACROYT_G017106 [Oculina patagonica]
MFCKGVVGRVKASPVITMEAVYLNLKRILITVTVRRDCIFDFEDGLSGWIKNGTAFNNQPTYGDNPTARNTDPANQLGDWWIGGYENRSSIDTPAGQEQGDAPQGTLASPSFNIKGNSISFLLGGGCDINVVRAELIVGSQVVRSTTGKCIETMVRETWDVQEFVGQRAHVKLVDHSSGGWGHINFDDLKGDINCDCKFDFEGGISDWIKTGTAFNNQPTYGDNPTARNKGQPANQQGDWWIGGYENRPSIDTPAGQEQGDAPQGTLASPSFNIKGNSISFLLGGGCDINFVRAELIVGSQVVRSTTGKCTETMVRETWDVQEFIGQRAHVKLVDATSGGWGHINFDDLKGDISCE